MENIFLTITVLSLGTAAVFAFFAWRARAEAQRVEDQRRLAEGNRGYVVREGQPTVGGATTLHVRVLEPQTP